jgi:glycosyltransferase involved in cell wall biosynthesis
VRVIALVTLPSLGAGNRVRIEQYAPLLRERGIDLRVSAFFDDATYRILYQPGRTARKVLGVARGLLRRVRDLRLASEADLVIVYRESAPLGPPLFERYLGRIGVPYLYDFDDALHLAPIHPANRRWSWLRHPSRAAETARRAAAVTTDNEYLAAWARRHNPNVTVINSPVDTDRHRPMVRSGDGPPVIGWVGSSTTAPYLGILDAPLRRLHARRPFVFRVIGGDYSHATATVDVRPYRLDEEPREVAAFEIGVQPAPDDEWSRAKGTFKALLYMAAEVPVVASRVGVIPEIVPHAEVGYCVASDDEWVEALDSLLADPVLRSRFGRAGRAWVEARYSLRVAAPRFAAALEAAAGGPRPRRVPSSVP